MIESGHHRLFILMGIFSCIFSPHPQYLLKANESSEVIGDTLKPDNSDPDDSSLDDMPAFTASSSCIQVLFPGHITGHTVSLKTTFLYGRIGGK